MERIGGNAKDAGLTIEGDFEAIRTAYECIENVFKKCPLKFKVSNDTNISVKGKCKQFGE